jgi:hypothetical protein
MSMKLENVPVADVEDIPVCRVFVATYKFVAIFMVIPSVKVAAFVSFSFFVAVFLFVFYVHHVVFVGFFRRRSECLENILHQILSSLIDVETISLPKYRPS